MAGVSPSRTVNTARAIAAQADLFLLNVFMTSFHRSTSGVLVHAAADHSGLVPSEIRSSVAAAGRFARYLPRRLSGSIPLSEPIVATCPPRSVAPVTL